MLWFGLFNKQQITLLFCSYLHSCMCTEPPQFKQDSQMTKREQLSLKEKKPSLPIKMEWSPKKDVKIEPEEEEEMFSDSEKGDTMEDLATKNKMLHDMINQLGEQIADQSKKIAEKDELIGKYQQMCEGLQNINSGYLILGSNSLHLSSALQLTSNFCAGMF